MTLPSTERSPWLVVPDLCINHSEYQTEHPWSVVSINSATSSCVTGLCLTSKLAHIHCLQLVLIRSCTPHQSTSIQVSQEPSVHMLLAHVEGCTITNRVRNLSTLSPFTPYTASPRLCCVSVCIFFALAGSCPRTDRLRHA